MNRRSDTTADRPPFQPAIPISEMVKLSPALGISAPAPLAARTPKFLGRSADLPSIQAVLSELHVAMIGAGSVGARAAFHVARQQVKRISIIDPATYKPESVLTQPMLPEHVGMEKAAYVGGICQAISPNTEVLTFRGEIQSLPPDALADPDVILLATDNLKAEVEAGQRGAWLGIPLIHAAVHGDTLTSQVRTFANRGEGPCPACGFGDVEWGMLREETTFRCTGPEGPEERTRVVPTMSTSHLCSLAADFAVNQLLRFVLHLGKSVGDTVLQYNGYTHATTVSPLVRRSGCPIEHAAWKRHSLEGPLREASLRQIAAAAGIRGRKLTGRPPTMIRIGDLSYVEGAFCCGELQPLGVFRDLRQSHQLGGCIHCDAPRQAIPYFTRRGAPVASLSASQLDQPLFSMLDDSMLDASMLGASAASGPTCALIYAGAETHLVAGNGSPARRSDGCRH